MWVTLTPWPCVTPTTRTMMVWITQHGERWHNRPDCPAISRKAPRALTFCQRCGEGEEQLSPSLPMWSFCQKHGWIIDVETAQHANAWTLEHRTVPDQREGSNGLTAAPLEKEGVWLLTSCAVATRVLPIPWRSMYRSVNPPFFSSIPKPRSSKNLLFGRSVSLFIFVPFCSIRLICRKRAMVDVGDLVLRKDSALVLGVAGAAGAGAADATVLGTEVFQALQAAASAAWGEGAMAWPERALSGSVPCLVVLERDALGIESCPMWKGSLQDEVQVNFAAILRASHPVGASLVRPLFASLLIPV